MPITSSDIIRFSLALLAWAAAPLSNAADVSVAWDPVEDDRLAFYRLGWGNESRDYTESVEIQAPEVFADVTGLSSGERYFFAVRACNTDEELCSDWSNEVAWFDPTRQRVGGAEDLLSTPVVYSGQFDAMLDPDGNEVSGQGVTYNETEALTWVDGRPRAIAVGDLYPQTWAVDLDHGPGFKVGAVRAGEWLRFTRHASVAYQARPVIEYASPDGGGSVRFTIGDETIAFTDLPATAGWDDWQQAELDRVVTVPAGEFEILAEVVARGADWYSLRLEPVEIEIQIPAPAALRIRFD